MLNWKLHRDLDDVFILVASAVLNRRIWMTRREFWQEFLNFKLRRNLDGAFDVVTSTIVNRSNQMRSREFLQ